jgi:ABC-type enterochelin transport system substrate-binding protein
MAQHAIANSEFLHGYYTKEEYARLDDFMKIDPGADVDPADVDIEQALKNAMADLAEIFGAELGQDAEQTL